MRHCINTCFLGNDLLDDAKLSVLWAQQGCADGYEAPTVAESSCMSSESAEQVASGRRLMKKRLARQRLRLRRHMRARSAVQEEMATDERMHAVTDLLLGLRGNA